MIIVIILILSGCRTINYQFSEEIRGAALKNEIQKRLEINPFPESGLIKGIYSEKDKSYRFEMNYHLHEEAFFLKFYELLSDQLIFDAQLVNGERNYNYFSMAFFSVKIGIILNYFRYIVEVYPAGVRGFKTNDDFFVLRDFSDNYYKYDGNRLIKKENSKNTVRYYYRKDSASVERVLFESSAMNFILIMD